VGPTIVQPIRLIVSNYPHQNRSREDCRFCHKDLIELEENENGGYDFIYVGGVLMYVDDEHIDEYLRKLRNLLRRGGVLVLRESVMGKTAEYPHNTEYPVCYRQKEYYRDAVPLKHVRSGQNYAYRVGELRKNLIRTKLSFLLEYQKISGTVLRLLAIKDLVWKPGRNRLINYYYVFRKEDG